MNYWTCLTGTRVKQIEEAEAEGRKENLES